MCCRRKVVRRRAEKGLKEEVNFQGQDIPIYLCLIREGEVNKKEGLRSRIGRVRRKAEERDWEE